MDIYFSDLTKEAQQIALDEAGALDPREMNWDIFPIANIYIPSVEDVIKEG